jgi:hypothetical protein
LSIVSLFPLSHSQWLEQALMIPVLSQMDGLSRRESEDFIVKKIQSLLIHEDEDTVTRADTKKFDDVPVLGKRCELIRIVRIRSACFFSFLFSDSFLSFVL